MDADERRSAVRTWNHITISFSNTMPENTHAVTETLYTATKSPVNREKALVNQNWCLNCKSAYTQGTWGARFRALQVQGPA
jgi:hypothetical protein